MEEKQLQYDRGMKKWQGLILSEHRERLDQLRKRYSQEYVAPVQMEVDEILATIRRAYLDRYKVWLAINEINVDGIYQEYQGFIQGFSSNYLVLNQQAIQIDTIRTIEFIDTAKFWQLQASR